MEQQKSDRVLQMETKIDIILQTMAEIKSDMKEFKSDHYTKELVDLKFQGIQQELKDIRESKRFIITQVIAVIGILLSAVTFIFK